MPVLRDWMRGVLGEARAAAERAYVMQRVARQTGMVDNVHLGGLRALVEARGKSNPSTVFRYHARNQPHRTALVYRDRRYSFFEINEQMDRVAAAMTSRGIGQGDSILLMSKNVPEFILLQTGVGRVGAAAVSISWRSSANELSYLLENSRARGIFFDASVASVVREVLPKFKSQVGERAFSLRGDVAGFTSYDDLLAEAPPAADPGSDQSEESAVVIYTSGTTGKPKGAVRKVSKDTVTAVMSFIGETPMRFGQTHLAVCPLYHATAYGLVNFSFVLGSTVVLLDSFDPESFVDALERHRVDHTAVVPTMLHQTLGLGVDAFRERDISRLKAIIAGGAPLSYELARKVMDSYGDVLFNFYGSTETGIVTIAKPADLRAAPGTIGRRIRGNRIRLLDEHGAIVEAGEIGELYVASGALVEGYHDNPEATRSSTRDGFFSVGDLARRDHRGYYFLEGRKKDMIISGGVNVYPREVESVLASHPAVGEAAVIGVPDDEWGEQVTAFVALDPGETCSEVDLLAYCREQLAGPKRPRAIHIMDQLPRNPTGKVLKRELRETNEA